MMKRFLICQACLLMAAMLLCGCRNNEPPATITDAARTPLTVVRMAADGDATPDETPTGRTFDSSGVIGQICRLEDIVEFARLEAAETATVSYRGTGTGGRNEALSPAQREELLAALKSLTVTVTTAEEADLASFPAEQAAYYEWTAAEGGVLRFSALKTAEALYFSFDWNLLAGEELDDPALLFRLNGDEGTLIFPE